MLASVEQPRIDVELEALVTEGRRKRLEAVPPPPSVASARNEFTPWRGQRGTPRSGLNLAGPWCGGSFEELEKMDTAQLEALVAEGRRKRPRGDRLASCRLDR